MRAWGIGEISVRADLREHHIGQWDGLTWDEVEQTWPGARQAWIDERWERPPGGESLSEFRNRIRAAVRDIAAESLRQRRLVIAHGGVVRALEHLAGVQPQPIDFVSGRWFHHHTRLLAGPPFVLPHPTAADL